MDSETKNLVRDASRGDRSAMADLYTRNVGYLTAVCSRYISNNEDRDDVLQGAFVKIFTALPRFQYRGEGSLRAWMTRIAVNEAIDFLKAGAGAQAIREENMPDIPDETEPEVEKVPQEQLQRMIRELPQGYRTVFNLFVFEQKSHREIASLLGITESTSASQFHRARAMLSGKIKEYLKSDR